MTQAILHFMLLASTFGQGPEYFTSPDNAARLAYADLRKTIAEDRPFTKYFSFAALTGLDPKQQVNWRRFAPFWINQMSVEKKASLPIEVPGSQGMLWKIDIRDYRWNVASWRTVAVREPFHRQPALLSTVPLLDADGRERQVNVGEALRLLAGELDEVKAFHCIAVVRFDWWFRETAETDRSPSYYDLLYSQNRFTGVGTKADVVRIPEQVEKEVTVPWKGGIWPGDGKFYKKGEFYHKEKIVVNQELVQSSLDNGSTRFKFVDIPKDRADWDKVWGLDKIKAFNKETKIQTVNGAVALGMLDDAKGSIVARHNRVLIFQPNFLCPGGVAMETIDTDKGTGEDDYVANAHKIPRGEIKVKAQELLNTLPNGGQAGFLVAGDNLARVEFADNRVAIDADAQDRRVRTPGSCFVCHANSYGVIAPINFARKAFIRPGITDVFLNREDRLLFDGFYADWEHNIEPVYQAPMKGLIERTTAWKGEKPWLGKDISGFVAEARRWYDSPVTVEQMARETGLSVEMFKAVAVESPLARLALAVRGQAMPRAVWDVDVYPEFVKLWALQVLKLGVPVGEKK